MVGAQNFVSQVRTITTRYRRHSLFLPAHQNIVIPTGAAFPASRYPDQNNIVIPTGATRPFLPRRFQRAGSRSGGIPLRSPRLATNSNSTCRSTKLCALGPHDHHLVAPASRLPCLSRSHRRDRLPPALSLEGLALSCEGRRSANATRTSIYPLSTLLDLPCSSGLPGLRPFFRAPSSKSSSQPKSLAPTSCLP